MNERALRELDAVILTQLQHREDPTPAARAKYRGMVRREVAGCTNCELRLQGSHCPFVAPAGNARFAVVTLTPTPARDPAMKLLRTMLREAKIDPEDALWTSTVSCEVNRDPTAVESMACHRHLQDQLAAAYAPFVLVIGGKALDAFRSDLTVTHHHGRVFVWNDSYVVMALHHPAAVVRGKSEFKQLIRDDLSRWHDLVYGDDNPLQWLGTECAWCKNEATFWDRDGVPMCSVHRDKKGGQWQKERERWNQSYAVQLTL